MNTQEVNFKVRLPKAFSNPWAKRGRIGRTLLKQLIPNLGSVVLALVLFWVASAQAAPWNSPAQSPGTVPMTINYQGRLADPDGAPVDSTDPGLGMTFSLYTQETGGSPVWSESHTGVAVSDGLFSVRLGSIEPLTTDLLTGDRWLGIRVGNDAEMSPREKLDAVPYAMQAGMAAEAAEAKIAHSGASDFKVGNETDATTIENGRMTLQRSRDQYGKTGSIVLVDSSDGNSWHLIHREEDLGFAFHRPDEGWPYKMFLHPNGDLWISGSLSNGGMIENNLQTPDELAAEQIERFSEGDVLCWGDGRLEFCSEFGDPLVQAVADANGKPIVIGAEVIKVLGPVQRGDMLVASEVPGYAIAVETPASGAVIAQALEDFDGERGVIKAMIRKF